jgi:lactate dehydrogenase-like 2-hydroxyacid dehydrogenase
MTGKVLVTGSSISDEYLERLRAARLEIHNPTGLLGEAELKAALNDSVAYLLGGDEIATSAALSQAEKLKIIAFLGVGYESFIDVTAATRHGVLVTNTPCTLTNSVAEFTIGQLINARRRLTQYCNAYRRGERGTEKKQRDLAGHRIGIVGLGAIGTRIAEVLCRGFGVQVSYYSRTQKPAEEERLGIMRCRRITDLAATCDALIVMTSENESSRGLIDESVISAMQPDTVLVNTARPDIVDPAALKQGLSCDRISVAVFDSFYHGEAGKRLLGQFAEDRLLVTDHIGSLTHDARDGMARKAVGSILNVLHTGDDENVVNRAAGHNIVNLAS